MRYNIFGYNREQFKETLEQKYGGHHLKLDEFKKELLKLNVQVATGANTSNPGKLRQTKKNIARILTILNQKEVQRN